jgi:2-keto-4-pentenoate hydratase/2-oxohepta-3-ene-1,7-dioic acid hydratase in catechol pathway
MKLVCFSRAERLGPTQTVRIGALVSDGRRVLDLVEGVEQRFGASETPPPVDPLTWLDMDGPWFARAREVHDELAARTGRDDDATPGLVLDRAAVRLHSPVPRPRKVICIGLNYRDHAAESNMAIPSSPVVFSKFPTAVVGPEEAVVVPASSSQVDYEAELAFVMGRHAKQVTRERAYEYVLGYTNFNDVSARDFQFADGQWQRGKSCDTFAPMGEYIATTDEIPDPHALSIKLRLNGETMQDSNTNQLIFGVPELVEFLSRTVTLEPGDVVATGTPPGVGFARKPPVFVKPGDVMEVDIEGLGVLRSAVAGE